MRPEIIDSLKKEYPVGTRVELVHMDDPQAPVKGTLGTVKGVDDIGSLLVAWDNGGSLNVLYGIDEVRKVGPIKTICYGKVKEWDSRESAIKFFIMCHVSSDGAERERYSIILDKLKAGQTVCSDN